MRLVQRLRAWIEASHPQALMPADALREWVAEEEALLGALPDPVGDLTVEAIAAETGVTVATVREWRIPGAYRVGKRLYIPAERWYEYRLRHRDRQAAGGRPSRIFEPLPRRRDRKIA